jgi:GNAT superfamily N-acetyltransferase
MTPPTISDNATPKRLLIRSLVPSDRAAWEVHARGYKTFYKTETTATEFEAAWQRLMLGSSAPDAVYGLGAEVRGELLGIAHYFFHTSVWAPGTHSACYLQDLFTAPHARGQGVARALIDGVAAAARERGAVRYYWLTQDNNATARLLYDKVAAFKGFLRYDYALGAKA